MSSNPHMHYIRFQAMEIMGQYNVLFAKVIDVCDNQINNIALGQILKEITLQIGKTTELINMLVANLNDSSYE